MDTKEKIKKIQFHNKHHKIMNNNNKVNKSLNDKDYNNEYFYIKRNNTKLIDNESSSNLKDNERGQIKPKKIFENSNQNNKDIRNTYFNLPLEKNYTSFNEYTYNKDNNCNENDMEEYKMILRQKKRKKISLEKNIEHEVEDKDEDKSMLENISTNSGKSIKFKFRKVNKIVKENSPKNDDDDNNIYENQLKEASSEKINDEASNEQSQDDSNDNKNDEIFFYNGCDNYIIKENFKNNMLNNGQILNIIPNQITSFTTINTISGQLNQLNKPKIEVNNYFNSNSFNFQEIYSKDNSKSINNIFSKKRKLKKRNKNQNIYKKKITKSSLSVSRHYEKNKKNDLNLNNTKINKSLSKTDLNFFNTSKIKKENMPILTESNKAYFKINDSFTKNNNKINLNNSRKNKVYKKPNKLKNNWSNVHQSFKYLNVNKNIFNILNGNNEDDKEIKEKKIIIEDINFKINENIENKKDKKSSLISKDQKEEDISLFSKSLEEYSNRIGPRISIHKQKKV